jgi:hypothetical protein
MKNVVMYIVGALVVMIVAASIIPTALQAFHNANTTGFTSGELAIYSVFGILVLVGVLVGIVYMAIGKKGG